MKKNQDRKNAEVTFLNDRGRITNKELATKLGVHPATVARWKKIDEWDKKLVQSVSHQNESSETEDDFYQSDLRHLTTLNERIDGYLHKTELLPSEILELAEAKYHIISCMEIINDHLRFPLTNEYGDEVPDFE